MTDNGWDRSADAWVEVIGDDGDWGRVAVLDPVLTTLASDLSGRVLDVGCGEGRFVRALSALGFAASGIDPTVSLIATARARDAAGDYHVGSAESLPFADTSFDLVTSVLALCDIERLDEALDETARVLRPGGHFLFANLSSINTAGHWVKGIAGQPRHYLVDDYMQVRPIRQRWSGVDIQNWHRPFSMYMEALLARGFILRRFLEPVAQGRFAGTKPKFDRMPNFVVMLWERGA